MRKQLLAEIVDGECQECGMLGPMIAVKGKTLCEACERDFEELE